MIKTYLFGNFVQSGSRFQRLRCLPPLRSSGARDGKIVVALRREGEGVLEILGFCLGLRLND